MAARTTACLMDPPASWYPFPRDSQSTSSATGACSGMAALHSFALHQQHDDECYDYVNCSVTFYNTVTVDCLLSPLLLLLLASTEDDLVGP